jgi:biopolymer transport protein ExbD
MLSTPQLRARQRRSTVRSQLFCTVGSPHYALAAITVVFMLMIVEVTFDNPPLQHLPVDRYPSRNATAMPDALRFDSMHLLIARDGRLYFGNAAVAAFDLPNRIRQSVRSGSPRKVFFVVDVRAKYGDVSRALDEVREADVWDVAFLAEAPYIHK